MRLRSALVCGIGLMTAMMTGCSVASPDAGHQVVWVEKPVFFGHGGVDPEPVTAGRSYAAFSTDAIDVDMLPQRADMEFDDMMTSSGVPVSFHVVATFRINDPVKLVTQFGADRYLDANKDPQGWQFWTRNIDQPMQNAVRDAVKKRDMQEMAISQTAADAVGAEVKAAALNIVAQTGVPIIITAINVGRVNPPDAIKTQRIETAAQEQRAITMQQMKLAEDQRKMAEQSRAAADNAYREAMDLSPAQYIELERIHMEQAVCGKGGCTIFLGGSPVPTLDTGKH